MTALWIAWACSVCLTACVTIMPSRLVNRLDAAQAAALAQHWLDLRVFDVARRGGGGLVFFGKVRRENQRGTHPPAERGIRTPRVRGACSRVLSIET